MKLIRVRGNTIFRQPLHWLISGLVAIVAVLSAGPAASMAVDGPAPGIVPPVELPAPPSVPDVPSVPVEVPKPPPLPAAPSVPQPPLPDLTPTPQQPTTPASDSPAGGDSTPVPAPGSSGAPGDPGRNDAAAPAGASAGGAPSVALPTSLSRAAGHAFQSPRQLRRERAGRRATAERRLRENVEKLSGCLLAIPAFERSVLVLRAGLGARAPITRNRLARRLSIPPERVRRAERRGLRSLRRANGRDGCAGRGAGNVSVTVGFTPLATGESVPDQAGPDLRAASRDQDDGGRGGRAKARSDRAVAARPKERPSEEGPPAAPGRIASSREELEDTYYWIMGLVGLAALVAVLAAAALLAVGRLPRRRPKVACAYCDSKRVAVNLGQGAYHCADCGFRGELPATYAPEGGKMGDDSYQDHSRTTAR